MMDDKYDDKTDTPSTNSGSDYRATEGNAVDNKVESQPVDAGKDGKAPFERKIHGIKWIFTVFSILSCVFLFALDTTVVADIQPDIIEELGDFEKFPWLATSYALPGVVLVLIESKLYGLFNIKWLYFCNFVLFQIGSAISGAAPTMDSMIVGRAIAGIGGCGIYVGSLTFFSVITTERERPFYISLITPVWGVGTVLGPVIGGGFAISPVGWRWGFFFNLFLIIIVLPVLVFLLPSINAAPDMTTREKCGRIDWLGLVIFCGWCVSFFMAIVFGGTLYEWTSYSMIILYVFLGVTTIGFVLSHIFHPFVAKEHRLYPSHMLKNFKLGILQWSIFAAPAAVYIAIFYVPLFFQFARDESPVQAATRLLPFVILIAVIAIANGLFMSKLGYYMPWFLVGSILSVIGGALMYTVDFDTPTTNIHGYTVLLGIGGGCFLMTAFGCVSDVVKDADDVFNAIGVLGLAQCFGITLFPALAGCIFQNLGTTLLEPVLRPEYTGDLNSVLAGSRSESYQSFSPELQDQVARVIVEAIKNLYLMTVIACGILVPLSPMLGMGKVGA